MKVRCTNLLDARSNPTSQSPWLTVGKVYHVLELVLDGHHRWLVRVITDKESPALFQLQQFEVVSARLPPSWIVNWTAKGAFALTTAVWTKPSFWESYYERDAEVERVFDIEARHIIDADP